MRIEESSDTGHKFTIWFPFVRSHMESIREGTLVAVENFSSNDQYIHYSILRITSVMPTHYAMMTDKDGYPGFVEEAVTNASKDWDQDEPSEDTTKIECKAVSSRLEIITERLPVKNTVPKIVQEKSLPMPGAWAKVLNTEWTNRILNRDLYDDEESIKIGTFANMDDVNILALWDMMIRTHFGVFAYTNAGKSNLLSTIISRVFKKPNHVKAVIYDLLGEYGLLLADTMYENDNTNIIFTRPDAVSDSLRMFWKSPLPENAKNAAIDIVETTIFPKNLRGQKGRFYKPVQKMLMDGKFRLLEPRYSNIGALLSNVEEEMVSAATKEIKGIYENSKDECTVENINMLQNRLKSYEFTSPNAKKSPAAGNQLRKDVISELDKTLELLDACKIDDKFKISIYQITDDLNDASNNSLYIIQDSNDAKLREFSKDLGNMMLDSRRKRGIESPSVSFIYDEADQFMSQKDENQYGMKASRHTAEQLARRGRKYGLGIAIATQRIVYLDTNIL